MNDNDMHITKEEHDAFKRLELKEYGVKLTDKQAYGKGSALLRLMDCVLEKTIQKRKPQFAVKISNQGTK